MPGDMMNTNWGELAALLCVGAAIVCALWGAVSSRD